MAQKSGKGMCSWISGLLGLVAGIAAYMASVAAVTFLPAVLIGVAVGCFVALVLSHLFCGNAEAAAQAPHAHAHSALADEALAEAEAGAHDAGADALAAREASVAAPKAEAVHEPSALVGEALAEAEAGVQDATADALAAREAGTAPAEAVTHEPSALVGEALAEAEAGVQDAAADALAARKPVASDGKPETLEKPRGGKADDLKKIKGVGPALEKKLNELGFWHFDQIAGWRKKEVEWVDDNLNFRGRIERDDWIRQAKALARGEETEFSERVAKGKVY